MLHSIVFDGQAMECSTKAYGCLQCRYSNAGESWCRDNLGTVFYFPDIGITWLRAELLSRLREAHAPSNGLRHGRIRLHLLRHERQRSFGKVSREHDNAVYVSYQIVARADCHVLLIRLQLDGHINGNDFEKLGRWRRANIASKDLFPSGI